MNGLYARKEVGVTEQGCRYVILQDSPTSFHVSLSKNNTVIYEHFESPPSREFLDNGIRNLETELLAKDVSNET